MSAKNDFKLSQIGQISMPVTNLDRAVGFYREKLGLPHLFTATGLAFFDCDGIRLMLSVPEKAELNPPGSIIYFKVADIQAAHQTLLERGVHFEDSPHLIARLETREVWMTFFRDSEGNLLSLISENKI
jgi:catechol 2,3-dioxygenase-like lactoylglutathione lyase family enzyme